MDRDSNKSNTSHAKGGEQRVTFLFDLFFRPILSVLWERVELSWVAPHDFESCAYTNFATRAIYLPQYCSCVLARRSVNVGGSANSTTAAYCHPELVSGSSEDSETSSE